MGWAGKINLGLKFFLKDYIESIGWNGLGVMPIRWNWMEWEIGGSDANWMELEGV